MNSQQCSRFILLAVPWVDSAAGRASFFDKRVRLFVFSKGYLRKKSGQQQR